MENSSKEKSNRDEINRKIFIVLRFKVVGISLRTVYLIYLNSITIGITYWITL